MGEYETKARVEAITRKLDDFRTSVGEMSENIEKSIEWSTSEITSSIDGLTEAVRDLAEVLTPVPRPTLLSYLRAAVGVTRKRRST